MLYLPRFVRLDSLLSGIFFFIAPFVRFVDPARLLTAPLPPMSAAFSLRNPYTAHASFDELGSFFSVEVPFATFSLACLISPRRGRSLFCFYSVIVFRLARLDLPIRSRLAYLALGLNPRFIVSF